MQHLLKTFILAPFVVALLIGACSGSKLADECARGSQDCACNSDNTCEPGLVCAVDGYCSPQGGQGGSATVTGGPSTGSNTGATTTTGTGAGGSTSTTTTGTGGGGQACGWSGQYSGPLLGRCDPMSCTDGTCGIAVAKGGFLTLDNFEGLILPPVMGAGTIPISWPSRDSRTGSWHQYSDPSAAAQMGVATTSGSALGSAQALHYSGGRGPWGASLALPIANCYDASAYDGISFWIKGDPSKGNTQVKFNVQTPATEPKISGGACTAGCQDHFAKMVDITPTWTRIKVAWSDLKRLACTTTAPAVPANFEPQKQVLSISFQQPDPSKGFDFWIDDITFDIDTRPANNFGNVITDAIYNELFKGTVAPYSYQGLVAAVAKYGNALAGTTNPLDNKHEAAAFLAHIAHETGSLTTVKEKCIETCGKGSPPLQCADTERTRACTSSPYYGRGALQLTGLGNYQSAQSAGFAGIVNNPDLVAASADFAFGTAVWFWMTPQSAVGVCHTAILGGSFGQTTRIINGIECGPGTLQNSRIGLYRAFCAALGINPQGTLSC